MQKNTILWLMATYFAFTCPLNEVSAAGNTPRPALESSPEVTGHSLGYAFTQSPWLTEEGQLVSRSANQSQNSRQLIRAIRNASAHGLNPESYGLSQIIRMMDVLSALDKPLPLSVRLQAIAPPTDYNRLRQSLSEQMDMAFVRLAKHLGEGVVNARATQRELFRDQPQINTERLLESVWSGRQTALQALDSIAPTQADYQRLTHRMRNLLTERAAGIERRAIRHNGILSASMKHADVMAIKLLLMESGELPPSTVLSSRFDTELVSAVRRFQQRQGLEPDGAVGRLTRNALNLSIDDEIVAVALSLERWRWMPRELGQKHLYINIPDYRVEFRDGAETKMSMVAVVGAVEHQTPTFSRDMSYMEFNPTWTVPRSITNEDLIPKEHEQPGYLVANQFEFLKRSDGKLVPIPPETVTEADFHKEYFPYTLRQRSGSFNDLGKVKFMMPNPYAIYLHDTPAKQHFKLNERAYSHGCIRLSDPDALATLLMKEDSYGSSAISKALQSPRTHRIRLRGSIPTHLTYMTTWIDDAGFVQRRNDIYQHDAALLSALQAGNTLLSTLYPPTASLAATSSPVRGKI